LRDAECSVTMALGRQFSERRGSGRPAECARIAEPGIINQDEQTVRRTWRGLHWLSKGRDGAFERTLRHALEWLGRTRQHASIPLRVGSDRSSYLRCDREYSRRNARHSLGHNHFPSHKLANVRQTSLKLHTTSTKNIPL